MISGVALRMSQALQLNVEYSADVLCQNPADGPSASEKETRRRLMWCCYVMDSWVGSGIDQLTMLNEADMKIQLPCHSRNFLYQIPCITETLDQGKVLEFLPRSMLSTSPADSMGMMAHFVRLIRIRRRVLRYS